MSIDIRGQIILFKKLDSDEFEFNMKYEYLDYCGRSFLKELSFVEDMEEYFKQSDIILRHFSDHSVLTLPIPFSKKVVLIKLNRPKIDSNTELRIELLKQKDQIEVLEARLAEYDVKDATAKRKTYAELDLIYEKGRGFYFNYDGYLSKEGADEKALEQFKEIMNDYYGFGTRVETPNNQRMYGSCVSIPVSNYNNGVQNTSKYACDLFENIDDMLEHLDKPYLNYSNGGSHYTHFYHVREFNVWIPALSFHALSGIWSNNCIQKIIPYFSNHSSYKTDSSPYADICDALNIKSFKATSYQIPRNGFQYKKFLMEWNNKCVIDKQIKREILKIAKGNAEAIINIRHCDIGLYSYLFY